MIIADKYPKSALDIAVMVLEGEEDCLWNEEQGFEHGLNGIGLMNVLAGSINVAMAALVDAKIECLDMLSGGVAATSPGIEGELLDPCPSEHEAFSAACVVGYLPMRDEIVEVWSKFSVTDSNATIDELVKAAIKAARGSNKILVDVIEESLQSQAQTSSKVTKPAIHDIAMKT